MSDAIVYIVDDDEAVLDSLSILLEATGFNVQGFTSARALLDAMSPPEHGCVLTDVRMPEMDGLELQEQINERRLNLPVIVMTGHGDVPLAVRAMKAGAVDFVQKPFEEETIIDCVRRALALSEEARSQEAAVADIQARLDLLTPREREVLDDLVAGHPNKVIAYNLGISPRTVEIHRARVMEKMQARNISELVRMTLAATDTPSSPSRA